MALSGCHSVYDVIWLRIKTFFFQKYQFCEILSGNVKETFWHGVDKFQPRIEKMKLRGFAKVKKRKKLLQKTWNNFEEDIKPSCGIEFRLDFARTGKYKMPKIKFLKRKTVSCGSFWKFNFLANCHKLKYWNITLIFKTCLHQGVEQQIMCYQWQREWLCNPDLCIPNPK